MSAFSEAALIDKLQKLNESQQSIQTLSHWIMYHRKKHEQSVQIWEKVLREVEKEKRLMYLYLANDILQTSRKKGAEFVLEFAKYMKPICVLVSNEGDEKTKRSVMRLLDIWDERQVFPKEFINDIKKVIDNKSISQPQQSTTTTKHSQQEDIISTLKNISHNETVLSQISTDAGTIQFDKLHHSAHDHEKARNILKTYQIKLEETQRLRTHLVQSLSQLVQKQESFLKDNIAQLEKCKQQLEQINQIKIIDDGANHDHTSSASEHKRQKIDHQSSHDPNSDLQKAYATYEDFMSALPVVAHKNVHLG